MPKYNHQILEKKWRETWVESDLYRVDENSVKPKYYCLDMFPYPSGAGLHVGHPKGYIATDIISRYKMLTGFSVLHPMGWDAFGLPAENYALANKVHPSVGTAANVVNYKRQLGLLGFSYDWSREINTTDPEYYKWTQWAFAEMFKRGLVHESNEPINWCPSCLTGLANEDLEDGNCERCGTAVEKKPLRQWVIKITDYAERLLKDLDKLTDWEEPIKEMQRNWLGKSEGASVKFKILSVADEHTPASGHPSRRGKFIEVFTTRPDTIFGATYLVVCPEHEIVTSYESSVTNIDEVKDYINKVKNKSDLERTDLNKDKTGVELKGIKALNPVNNLEIPIYVADYVLSGYGTGAIMAVPAHDERDWEFAKKYDLPIKVVVQPPALGNFNRNAEDLAAGAPNEIRVEVDFWSGYGQAVNSAFLDGLETAEAKRVMIDWLEKYKLGTGKTNWKLKDWVFSRQRYWGEPIPLIHCEHCKSEEKLNEGEKLNPGWFVDENLPVILPTVESYQPSGTGESPLANIADWVNVKCPRCGGEAHRETNTMPSWAGSSSYYLAYVMQGQTLGLKNISDYKSAFDKWLPVDMYVGGAEHATRHLIYARFWHKFLFDIGVVSTDEPFTEFHQVGLILAEDGRKMSKRWGNVINPDQIVESHGADAMRVYEMFMGPFNQPVAWNTNGLTGARKFLDKVWNLSEKLSADSDSRDVERMLHKTIKKVEKDIEDMAFNTAVSAMMILTNAWTEQATVNRQNFQSFILILSPFAPHLAEELWQVAGGTDSVFKQIWPACDSTLARDEKINLIIQVNGKLRDTLEVDFDTEEEEAKKLAMSSEKVVKWIEGKEIVKVVVVKNRLVNVVTK